MERILAWRKADEIAIEHRRNRIYNLPSRKKRNKSLHRMVALRSFAEKSRRHNFDINLSQRQQNFHHEQSFSCFDFRFASDNSPQRLHFHFPAVASSASCRPCRSYFLDRRRRDDSRNVLRWRKQFHHSFAHADKKSQRLQLLCKTTPAKRL